MAVEYRLGIFLLLPILTTAISVYNGGDVNFTCTLSPQQGSNVLRVWEYNGPQSSHAIISIGIEKKGKYASDDRFEISTVGGHTILTISNVELSDGGDYKCSEFIPGGGSQQWNLDIYVMPDRPLITQTNEADEGSVYTVECVVRRGKPPPTITWTFTDSEGENVDISGAYTNTRQFPYANGTTSIFSTLGIMLTRQMQGGHFVCSSSQPNIDPFYNQISSQRINNAFYAPLTPHISGVNRTLTQGTRNLISCSAGHASPAANISWSLKAVSGEVTTPDVYREFVVQENGYFRTESEVYIHATRELNRATLTCRASNEVSNRQQIGSIAESALLDINYAPVMAIEGIGPESNASQSISVTEGDRFTIQCRVLDSKPAATSVDWLLNSNILHTGYGNRYSVTRTLPAVTLTINSVSRADKGTWHCRGTNQVFYGFSKEYKVNVLHKPICKQGVVVKFAAGIGSSVELMCSVLANPSAEVGFLWTKDGVALRKPASPIKTSTDTAVSSYIITPREEKDYGSYECYAENSVGNMDNPCIIELTLPGPADAPRSCSVINITLTSFSIKCLPSFDGGSLANYALMMMIDNNQYIVRSNRTVPTFYVSGLAENLNYTFQVCASNSQYWGKKDCTSTFTAKTAAQYIITGNSETVTPAIASSFVTLTPTKIYIIIGVSCAALASLVIAAAICCNVKPPKRMRKSRPDEDQQSQDVTEVNASRKLSHTNQFIPSTMLTPTKPPRLGASHEPPIPAAREGSSRATIEQPTLGTTSDRTYFELMDEVKESIRTGQLRMIDEEDEEGEINPDKVKITLL